MVSLRFILIVGLLITTISCSDDKTNSPAPSSQKPPAPASEPTPSTDDTAEVSPTPIVSDEYVDAQTAVLIQEVRNQVAADPVSHANKILNIEFANRIFKVNFVPGKNPRLSLVTHSAKAFWFELTKTSGNTQIMNAYKVSKSLNNTKSEGVIYSAEVKNLKSQENKTLSIIAIKDVQTNAVVHVFYMKKTGSAKVSYLPGYNYAKDLTKASKLFLQRVLEDNSVEGEFYGVITEEKNISNATKFELTISNNFVFLSQPLTGHLRPDQPNTIPLITDYKSFWKMFFFGSAAYRVIKDASYIIESERNPVELQALNLELRIESKEQIKGKSNTLPIKFFVEFK